MVVPGSIESYKTLNRTKMRNRVFLAVALLCQSFIFFYLYQSLSRLCPGAYNTQQAVSLKQFRNDSNTGYQRNDSNNVCQRKYRHLPKCIVFGVKKAGTRALLEYLDIHPDIEIAMKESHFFEKDEEYRKGMEYYRHQMPYSFENQLTVEKTPAYFISLVAQKRIYHMNSSVLLLLIVRDPVKRLISDYYHMKRHKLSVPDSFESAVLDSDGNINTQFIPVNVSLYSEHFSRWLQHFPRKQIHIVDGDNIVNDPFNEMYNVETFLGLKHMIRPDNFYFDSKKKFYCVAKENDRHCLGKYKGQIHPDVEPSVLQKLRGFYKESNKKFFEISNQTFNW